MIDPVSVGLGAVAAGAVYRLCVKWWPAVEVMTGMAARHAAREEEKTEQEQHDERGRQARAAREAQGRQSTQTEVILLYQCKGSDGTDVVQVLRRKPGPKELPVAQDWWNTNKFVHIIWVEPQNAPAFFEEHPAATEVWVAKRERNGHPDFVPKIAFALSDRDVFDKLLGLSGLDQQEIDDEMLTFENLGDPLTLCTKLERLTGDAYSAYVCEVHTPDEPMIRHLMGLPAVSS